MKLAVFGGTGEGRQLAQALADLGHDICLFVATDYGAQVAQASHGFAVHSQRLDQAAMVTILRDKGFDAVVDASHPFARLVTENLTEACQGAKLAYYRYLRPRPQAASGDVHYFDDAAACADYLAEAMAKELGNVFLTLGSKALADFQQLDKDRIYLRIIPMVQSLQQALDCGYSPQRIVCMQGPFSQEMNRVMFQESRTRWMVTKDSGKEGGLAEKIRAAQEAGAISLILKRPQEEGYTWQQLMDIFRSSST